MIVVYPGDRGLCDGSIPRPGSPTECVYVSLSMVSCNTNTLQLQRIRRNGQRKKERNKERICADVQQLL